METGNKISIWKIMVNDKVTYYASMTIALVLILLLMASFSRNKVLPVYFITTIIVLLGAVGVSVLRVIKIKSILQNGQTLNGIVTSKDFNPAQGNLNLNYLIDDNPHPACTSAPITKFSSNLKAGDTITLMVDPNNPKTAFLKELFLK